MRVKHLITALQKAGCKFNAGVSQIETTFLDTTLYKGQRFEKERILDVRA